LGREGGVVGSVISELGGGAGSGEAKHCPDFSPIWCISATCTFLQMVDKVTALGHP